MIFASLLLGVMLQKWRSDIESRFIKTIFSKDSEESKDKGREELHNLESCWCGGWWGHVLQRRESYLTAAMFTGWLPPPPFLRDQISLHIVPTPVLPKWSTADSANHWRCHPTIVSFNGGGGKPILSLRLLTSLFKISFCQAQLKSSWEVLLFMPLVSLMLI